MKYWTNQLRRVFLCLPLLTAGYCVAQGNVIAEGMYGAVPSNGSVNDGAVRWNEAKRWTLTEANDGDLTIHTSAVFQFADFDSGFVEYRISQDWRLLGYELVQGKPVNLKSTSSFACEVGGALNCLSKVDEKTAWTTSLGIDPPYTLSCYDYEVSGGVVWTLAIALKNLPRTIGQVTKVPVVGLNDKGDMKQLALLGTNDFRYVGRKKLSFALGTIQADVFTIPEMAIWLAPSGLVLAVSEGPDKAPKIELISIEKGRERFLPDLEPPPSR